MLSGVRFIELALTIKSITNVRIKFKCLYFAHQIDLKNEKWFSLSLRSIKKTNRTWNGFFTLNLEIRNQNCLFVCWFDRQISRIFEFFPYTYGWRSTRLFICFHVYAAFFSLLLLISIPFPNSWLLKSVEQNEDQSCKNREKRRRTRSEKARKKLVILAEIKPVWWLAVIQVYSRQNLLFFSAKYEICPVCDRLSLFFLLSLCEMTNAQNKYLHVENNHNYNGSSICDKRAIYYVFACSPMSYTKQ